MVVKSDCKYASEPNDTGMIWCDKLGIYVTAKEKDSCPHYEKK